MNFKNSLILFLAFFMSASLLSADQTKARMMKLGKPVICPKTGEYNVGDRGPSNGWIIYKKPAASGQSDSACWQYIEAAPSDLEKTSAWSNVTDRLVGGTSTGVGNGKENTQKIIAQAGHTESAAKSCVDLYVEYNGKTFHDWFLPSKDELDLMYLILKRPNTRKAVGGFKEAWYWSSSEYEGNAESAWMQAFYYDAPYDVYRIYYHKDDGFKKFDCTISRVRCARAF
ncbi:MAG: hypothetical protein V1647_00840 [Pseudomonadota bacterium]